MSNCGIYGGCRLFPWHGIHLEKTWWSEFVSSSLTIHLHRIYYSIPDGSPMSCKFQSLSSYVIFRKGGAIEWKLVQEDQTSQRSCEDDVIAKNECTMDLQNLHCCAQDLSLPDAYKFIRVYNNNMSTMNWVSIRTNKVTKNVDLDKNYVHEIHNKTGWKSLISLASLILEISSPKS